MEENVVNTKKKNVLIIVLSAIIVLIIVALILLVLFGDKLRSNKSNTGNNNSTNNANQEVLESNNSKKAMEVLNSFGYEVLINYLEQTIDTMPLDTELVNGFIKKEHLNIGTMADYMYKDKILRLTPSYSQEGNYLKANDFFEFYKNTFGEEYNKNLIADNINFEQFEDINELSEVKNHTACNLNNLDKCYVLVRIANSHPYPTITMEELGYNTDGVVKGVLKIDYTKENGNSSKENKEYKFLIDFGNDDTEYYLKKMYIYSK